MIETILKINQPTADTGLFYSREIVEEAIEQALKKPLPVLLGAPDSATIDLSRVAGFVRHIFIEDDELKVDINWVDTPTGIIAATLKDKVTLRYRPCGTGSVREGGQVSDYSLSCVYVEAATRPC